MSIYDSNCSEETLLHYLIRYVGVVNDDKHLNHILEVIFEHPNASEKLKLLTKAVSKFKFLTK